MVKRVHCTVIRSVCSGRSHADSAEPAPPSRYDYTSIVSKTDAGAESAEDGPRQKSGPYRHRRKIPHGLVVDFLA